MSDQFHHLGTFTFTIRFSKQKTLSGWRGSDVAFAVHHGPVRTYLSVHIPASKLDEELESR